MRGLEKKLNQTLAKRGPITSSNLAPEAQSLAWKRATAKKIREMQAGKFTTLEQLEARLKQR